MDIKTLYKGSVVEPEPESKQLNCTFYGSSKTLVGKSIFITTILSR